MQKQKKIGIWGIVLMVAAAIYGLGNTAIAYYQMGYAAIMWYVLAALFFFLPSALMFAEYGSVLKDARGGIYSWLEFAIGERGAFIGTFIWLASWIIWLLSNTSMNFINLSETLWGRDMTATWHLGGLSSTATLGILGSLFILAVTFCVTRGFDKIAKISAVSGIFVFILTGFVLLGSVLVLFFHHGHLAQPLTARALVMSPNKNFMSPLAILSFFVYAVFAYGGMETMGGISDNVRDAQRNFPRGIMLAAGLMFGAYALLIFCWGVSANWHRVLGGQNVTLGNVGYVLISNLGYTLACSLHVSSANALIISRWLVRAMGAVQLLAFTASFFVLVYSPLKSFIIGSPQKFWPQRLTKLNAAGMPANAMWLQAGIIVVVLLVISFGGTTMQGFYTILVDMMNVSSSVPYLFLIGAFPFFKRRVAALEAQQDLGQPFTAFTNPTGTTLTVVVAWFLVFFGVVFSVIQPLFSHDVKTFFWTAIGPVAFAVIAIIMYHYTNAHEARILNAELRMQEDDEND